MPVTTRDSQQSGNEVGASWTDVGLASRWTSGKGGLDPLSGHHEPGVTSEIAAFRPVLDYGKSTIEGINGN